MTNSFLCHFDYQSHSTQRHLYCVRTAPGRILAGKGQRKAWIEACVGFRDFMVSHIPTRLFRGTSSCFISFGQRKEKREKEERKRRKQRKNEEKGESPSLDRWLFRLSRSSVTMWQRGLFLRIDGEAGEEWRTWCRSISVPWN